MRSDLVILGEYNPDSATHRATDAAIRHSLFGLKAELTASWVSTYPASKHTVGEFAGFGWSVSGCPGGGREFGNATDWKIAQPGQH